jgi:hypothetical protein
MSIPAWATLSPPSGLTNKTTLCINRRTLLDSSETVTTNITLEFPTCQGGAQTNDSTFVLTINGPFEPPDCQVFYGNLATTAGNTVFGASSNVLSLSPAWWGCTDGADCTTAVKAAWAAAKGDAATYVTGTKARSLVFPPGAFTLSDKKVFAITPAHSGVHVLGAGAAATRIIYTYNNNEADNAPFSLDASTADFSTVKQVSGLVIKDLVFTGPTSDMTTNFAKWLYITGGDRVRVKLRHAVSLACAERLPLSV